MLQPRYLSPDTATAALRRLKPTPDELTAFRQHLAEMLRHLDPNKIERHGETHILDFLRSVSRPPEGGTRYGNVQDKRDLVLHLGDTADSPVGVVLEIKGPRNPKEMLAPDDLNRKALHQLLLYYLEDRTDDKADDFKRLIVTTGYEWYVFDALDFHRLFFKDKGFVKDFQTWKAGAKAATDTDFFYKSIASKKLAALEGELPVVYVDLRPGVPTAPARLTALYRLFHPAYLLKEPLTGRRDPNTLNQEFYHELLYLMGLREDKQAGVRRIGRCPEDARQHGSLLENTLRKLETGHGLNYVPEADRLRYGDTPAAQREGVALALCLMWVNRLLFLKLLEGQMVRYHDAAHAAAFRFLHPQRLSDYDEVQTLFFEVLNRAPADRTPDVLAAFPEVPYLNSSLFEPSELEHQALDVSGLRDGLGLAPFPGSVLSRKGAPVVPTTTAHTSAAPQWKALPYLLHFLDAYDFATDPTTSHAAPPAEAPVAPAARPLLSAAVLGLVFEKINGYKDGSFYTPGFVTMYMARQTLGRAVVRHFRQAPDFPELAQCDTLDDLLDAVAPAKRPRRREYAAHFNTLTVLDPAVGSGHFLVSALNELLALKSRLGLFLDEEGAVLPYSLDVEHDELVVTDADGLPAPYRVGSFDAETGQRTVGPERTRLQQALFREKRALMEHALFGVDLNPNSVRICRLRLWIELLKHAYYKPDTQWRELETLPNLDLNVKTGNSLLARFPLDADLSEVFQKGKFSLKEYRGAVHDYFSSRGRDDKNRLLGFFQQLKEQFTAVLHKKDKKREELRLARNKIIVLSTQTSLLPETKKQEEARHFAVRQLELRAAQLQADIDAHEQGALYRDAFEWRFEFPEVLDEAGRFRGFDVVLGNPPYIRQEEFSALKPYLKQRFATFDGKADLYVYFLELGLGLLKPGGELSYIAPNKWLRAGYGAPLRRWLPATNTLVEFLDFGDLPVFAEATTYPAILSVSRAVPTPDSRFRAALLPKLPPPLLDTLVLDHARPVTQAGLQPEGWNLADDASQELLTKMKAAGTPLGEYVGGKIYYGIKTGLNPVFVIKEDVRNKLVAEDPKSAEILRPFAAGRDVKRYQPLVTTNYLVSLPSGWTRKKLGWTKNKRGVYAIPPVTSPKYKTPWDVLVAHYPAVAAYLLPHEAAAAARADKGHYWWELRACDYYDEFEKNKIVYQVFQVKPVFTLDTQGTYVNNATYIIPGEDYFLLGILNSKIGWMLIENYCTQIQNGYQLIFDYFGKIPIPAATAEEQAAVAALVEQVLAAKAADAAADTQALETQLDALVAALYGVALPA
ncbi:type IIG restriction enzyme/methyltransferase [Hymenobacter psychrotolerans]|uniref:site-specific DNA-methyltransferase (adenine-specific) n=1 Tax=Hymenobacter psychrotolerans DSM 18569 TaxID=1121959 RepID=A0A1M6P8Q2_9BACT|nr:Eco57I restriction-modification methylase domain-containing protein [Hymenobacter psychrotolerans]SHK04294.1 Type II restriction/modification system, DNA methylase subunit YeeA [Hymenobacter psychrotolerans DSM 18569]